MYVATKPGPQEPCGPSLAVKHIYVDVLRLIQSPKDQQQKTKGHLQAWRKNNKNNWDPPQKNKNFKK